MLILHDSNQIDSIRENLNRISSTRSELYFSQLESNYLVNTLFMSGTDRSRFKTNSIDLAWLYFEKNMSLDGLAYATYCPMSLSTSCC